MTTAPRGGLGNGPVVGNNMFDPSVLFDLDDILMAGDYSNDMQTSLVHTPIKEEPENDHDDHRYRSQSHLKLKNSKFCSISFYLL